MKKVLKSRLFIAIITAIICITGTAYAAGQIFASDITYKNTTVDKALDDLYTTASEYVKLENETTVSSSNLLNGVTAYDNLGNLITGTISINNGLTDTINIPSNYSLATYDYNCGFEPSFIYFEWSNGWTWLLLNNNVYVYQTNDGSSYHTINNGIATSSTSFSLDITNNTGLKGLSAKIYVLK